MSADPELELKKAFKTLFDADATLASLMGGSVRCFDHAVENQPDPYIVMNFVSEQNWDTDLEFGREHVVQFSVWSSYEGTKEAKQILRRIYDMIQNDAAGLTLTDHNLVNLYYTFGDVVREPDGQSYQAVAQYRAITEET